MALIAGEFALKLKSPVEASVKKGSEFMTFALPEVPAHCEIEFTTRLFVPPKPLELPQIIHWLKICQPVYPCEETVNAPELFVNVL